MAMSRSSFYHRGFLFLSFWTMLLCLRRCIVLPSNSIHHTKTNCAFGPLLYLGNSVLTTSYSQFDQRTNFTSITPVFDGIIIILCHLLCFYIMVGFTVTQMWSIFRVWHANPQGDSYIRILNLVLCRKNDQKLTYLNSQHNRIPIKCPPTNKCAQSPGAWRSTTQQWCLHNFAHEVPLVPHPH